VDFLRFFLGLSTGLILVVGTAWWSYWVACRLASDPEDAWGRVSAAVVAGIWLATVGFFLLFSANGFRPLPAVLGIVALALFARAWPGAVYEHASRDWHQLREEGLGWLRSTWGAVTGAIGALALLRTLLTPPLGWDWMTYRGPRAVHFLQGYDWALPQAPGIWNMCRHYVAGTEVLAAWTMLPFHNDFATALGHFMHWISLGACVASLAHALGLRGDTRGLSIAAALNMPIAYVLIGTGYSGLLAAVGTTAAAAHGARFAQGGNVSHAALAIVGLGIAVGAGITNVVPALLVGLLLTAFAATRSDRRHAMGAVVIGTAVALLVFVPWLLVAYRDTGAPLSPLPATLFGIELGRSNAEVDFAQTFFYEGEYTWAKESTTVRHWFVHPLIYENFGVLGGVVVIGCVPGAWVARGRWRGLLIAGGMSVALFASMFPPGMNMIRLTGGPGITRFLVGALAVLAPIAMAATERGDAGRLYRQVVVVNVIGLAIFNALHGWMFYERMPVLIMAMVFAVGMPLLFKLGRNDASLGLVLAFVALSVGGWYLRKEQLRRRATATQTAFQFHGSPRYWAPVAAALDTPDRPRTIAITGGLGHGAMSWPPYYFFGSELQNTVLHVTSTASGEILTATSPASIRRSRAEWFRRLADANVDAVVAFPGPSPELEWMSNRPEVFERIAGDANWGAFLLGH